MKIWFDTEFIDTGSTIELISIGMVREDGKTYYAENAQCHLNNAGDWVKEHVIKLLTGPTKHRSLIAYEVKAFSGHRPQLWAYYGSYDWVALCQLYGTMMHLPTNWPMMVLDVKQLCLSMGDPQLPQQKTPEHHALNDALWTKEAYDFLMTRKWQDGKHG